MNEPWRTPARALRSDLSLSGASRSPASPARASSTSICRRSSPTEARAASSRSMPRTTWAQAAPPHDALTRIRRDYPVSLHGVCMSIGGPQPLDKSSSRALQGACRSLRAGAGFRAPRLVDARDHLLQRSAAPALHGGDARARRRSHRRGAGGDRPPDPAREPVDLRRLPGIDDERDRLHPRSSSGAPGAACCSTSTMSSSRPPITASPRSTISPIFRSNMSARSISPDTPSRPTTRAIFC